MARNTILIDHGWKGIQRDIAKLRGRAVKVGLRAGGPSNKGVPVVQYAAFQELGTDRIPARPFMRRTADMGTAPLQKFAQSLVARLMAGQISVEAVLDSMGLWYQARIRATIRSAKTWAAPNSPKTIKRKKSSSPLIDDAIMLNSIDYQKE